jgi:hypothetical protein
MGIVTEIPVSAFILSSMLLENRTNNKVLPGSIGRYLCLVQYDSTLGTDVNIVFDPDPAEAGNIDARLNCEHHSLEDLFLEAWYDPRLLVDI